MLSQYSEQQLSRYNHVRKSTFCFLLPNSGFKFRSATA